MRISDWSSDVCSSDLVGLPVQKRRVAMVYQQFINYPMLTVYENIASPMRVAGADRATVDRKVRAAAELLRLTPYLDRTPLHLSGGQQQRTAIARALVKEAKLRSEEHTSELQSLMRISYAVFCLKKKKQPNIRHNN